MLRFVLSGAAFVALSLAATQAGAITFRADHSGRGQAGFLPVEPTTITLTSQGSEFGFTARFTFASSLLRVRALSDNAAWSCRQISSSQIEVVWQSGQSISGNCHVHFEPLASTTFPQTTAVVASEVSCVGFSGDTCNVQSGSFTAIGPRIKRSPSTGAYSLSSSVGLAAPFRDIVISNAGADDSQLLVTSASTGAPITVSPSGSGASLGPGASRTYRVSCSTATAGSFDRDITFAHNATPMDASPLRYDFNCRIRVPPTLVYTPVAGANVPISGTVASTPTTEIDVDVSGGESGGSRTLSCSVPANYSVTVEPPGGSFVAGTSGGRIRLGCNSAAQPLPATLTCTESASPVPVTRTWPISCTSDEAFTSTPPFSEPIVLNGLVGGPAPTAMFTVTNTGTEGTVLALDAPTGLGGALSITPSAAVGVAQGSSGVTYTVTCSTLAAFAGTQTLSIAHDAPGSPSTREVSCNILTPPTLDYEPGFGNAVQVSASVDAATPTTNIAVTTTGGDPGGERSLSCSVNQPNYTVSVDTSPFATGAAGNVRLGCDSIAQQAGLLSCTETPGGTVRQWTLSCVNTAVYTSSPRPGSAIGVYFPIGETGFVDADVAVSNKGTANLSVSGCVQSPSLFFGVNFTPNPIPGNSDGTLNVTCPVPDLGSADFRTLSCNTNDPTRPSIVYKLICVAPPTTDPGEGASPEERLTSPTPDGGANLGSATVIATLDNGDEIVVVGAPSGGEDGDGRVYVYVRPAGGGGGAMADAKLVPRKLGRPVATLMAPANRGKAHAKGIGNKFGESVAISEDGQVIAVGAPTGGGDNTGQVLVFEMPPGGWDDLDGLTPTAVDPPADPGVVPTDFGAQVSFTDDGMLVVGAPGAIVSSVDDAGAAFVFDAGFAPLGSPVTATSPEPGAAFGEAIALGNGLLAIGAPGENSSTGAAYFFELDAGVVGPANQQTPAGGSFGDKWGSSIAVGDGAVVVGAPNDDTAAGADSGSATVFLQDGGNSVRPAGQLIPDAGMGTEGAGMAIATNGDVVVLGAPFSDIDGQEDRGRALVFDLDAAITGNVRPAGYYENSIGEAGDQFGGAVGMSRVLMLIGAPLSDEGPDVDEGRIDPFALDRIFRGGFDR